MSTVIFAWMIHVRHLRFEIFVVGFCVLPIIKLYSNTTIKIKVDWIVVADVGVGVVG